MENFRVKMYLANGNDINISLSKEMADKLLDNIMYSGDDWQKICSSPEYEQIIYIKRSEIVMIECEKE